MRGLEALISITLKHFKFDEVPGHPSQRLAPRPSEGEFHSHRSGNKFPQNIKHLRNVQDKGLLCNNTSEWRIGDGEMERVYRCVPLRAQVLGIVASIKNGMDLFGVLQLLWDNLSTKASLKFYFLSRNAPQEKSPAIIIEAQWLS